MFITFLRGALLMIAHANSEEGKSNEKEKVAHIPLCKVRAHVTVQQNGRTAEERGKEGREKKKEGVLRETVLPMSLPLIADHQIHEMGTWIQVSCSREKTYSIDIVYFFFLYCLSLSFSSTPFSFVEGATYKTYP